MPVARMGWKPLQKEHSGLSEKVDSDLNADSDPRFALEVSAVRLEVLNQPREDENITAQLCNYVQSSEWQEGRNCTVPYLFHKKLCFHMPKRLRTVKNILAMLSLEK